MAHTLHLQVEEPSPPEPEPVFDDILRETTSPVSLSFNKSILQLIKDTWDKPPSMMQISRITENLYKTHGTDIEFLNKHPLPNSIIVESSQSRGYNKSKVTPMNKERR